MNEDLFSISTNYGQTAQTDSLGLGGTDSASTITTGTTPSVAGMNFTAASAGIQAIGSIASAISNVNAFKAQLQAQTDAKIANMNNVMDSYTYKQVKLQDELNLLDNAFADKASERALDGMKSLAMAKAAAAETGTSGGTTQQAITQVKTDELYDIGVINAQRRNALRNVLSQKEASKLEAVNAFKTITSGGVNYKANIFASALGGASNALGNILSTMPKDVALDVFNLNSTGANFDINSTRPQG